jgi:hypothetical protein
MIVFPGMWTSCIDRTVTDLSLAIFIIGYITFVFGIEMAIRGLFYDFKPRGRWNTPICLAIIAFLHLMTWMPTIIWPTYPRCFGSLALFPMRYEVMTLVIVSVLIFTFLLLAALISTRLMRTSIVDANERIAASRMCYYLLSAAFLYVSTSNRCGSKPNCV